MKSIHVLYSPRAVAWQGHRVAAAFADCFERLGFKVTCGTRMWDFKRSDTLFLMAETAAAQVHGRWDGLVCLYNISEVYTRTVGHHWFGRIQKLGNRAGWIDQRIDWIWDYAPQNGPAFARKGYHQRTFCPLTYHPSYDRERLEPLHDVAFVGMVRRHSRRHSFIDFLERRGLNVWAGPRRNRRLGDEEVLAAQQHSRVWLHLHQGSGDRINYPSTRIVQLGAPAGIPAVIERPNWTPMPADTCRLFDIGDHAGLLEQVRWCLDNPGEADEMAARALAFLRSEYQMLPVVENSAREAGLFET